MTDYLVKYICNSLKPICEVDNPDLCALMKKSQPAYNIPSRKYLSTKILPAKTTKLHINICKQLSKIRTICLTIDIWTNTTMRAYIGITGHFTEDFQLQSVMLACRRFDGSHTAENVLSNYQDIIDQFTLDGKVGYIITDNAANMLKAFVKFPGVKADSGDNESDESDDEDEDVYMPVDSLYVCWIICLSISHVSYTLYS